MPESKGSTQRRPPETRASQSGSEFDQPVEMREVLGKASNTSELARKTSVPTGHANEGSSSDKA